MPSTREKARVALVKGDDRYTTVSRALEAIAGDIDVGGKERILIKPNFVLTHTPNAVTHVDAVRAVLDFLRQRTGAWITIAESSATGDTLDAFRNYGYMELLKEYKVELVDLNRGEWVHVPAYGGGFGATQRRLSRTVVESDYRISVGPPKTHDTVIITLSTKNMVMGSLMRDQRETDAGGLFARAATAINRKVPAAARNSNMLGGLRSAVVHRAFHSDKPAMHAGYRLMNLNLYRLIPHVYPHLAILDGFNAMEGAGPAFGDPVNLGCAWASTDFLAADAVGAAIMGFDIDEVGYLHYCKVKGLGAADAPRIDVLGETIAACRRPFRHHPSTTQQRAWQIAGVERYL